MKKKNNSVTLEEHLDKEYGKKGVPKREKYEQGFEAFKYTVSTKKSVKKINTLNIK